MRTDPDPVRIILQMEEQERNGEGAAGPGTVPDRAGILRRIETHPWVPADDAPDQQAESKPL